MAHPKSFHNSFFSADRATKAVDVYMAANYIYWVDARQSAQTLNLEGGIHRIKPDGTGLQDILTSGIGSHSIQGLAVDWIAGVYPCIVGNFGYIDLSFLLLKSDQLISAGVSSHFDWSSQN